MIVFEGQSYFFKEQTSAKRSDAASKAFAKGDWLAAARPRDCFIKILLYRLSHEGFEVQIAVNEADGLLAFLQLSVGVR